MADITNVNLVFFRKVRGIAPLARFAARDDGGVTICAPDEMEVRTLHRVRFDARGRSQVQETYGVETLRRIEVAPESDEGCIGVTDDDLYLFRQGRKGRFLPDRRAQYIDIALNIAGQRFAAAFSDMLASGCALAMGDIGGRVMWTKDIPFPISRLAVDRTAQHIAVVGDSGDLMLLDAARNTLMRHRQEAPLRAVATIGPERTAFAGGGGVGMVNAEGHLLWFTELLGEPVEIALDGEGCTTAVLLRLDDSSGRLVLLSPDGMPNWDLDFDEARPTGLSLSENGRFCAVTLRDGSLSVYELQFGERLASASSEQVITEARSASEAGNYRAALETLRTRLAVVPSDLDACDLLLRVLNDFQTQALTRAQTAEAVSDFREADACLDGLLTDDPLNEEAVRLRRALRLRWAQAALTAGREAIGDGDGVTAETRFLEAIAADPLDRDAREALADARWAAASGALEKGRALQRVGDYPGAIAALTEAQARGASGPEITGLLRDARVGEALTLGGSLYQDRQYAAALFQYKKVLRLDPENTEALQKVSYSQNFLQDTQLSDRFSRLE